MQVSTVSERLGFTVRSIEVMKWLGFVAMFIEHAAHYAFQVTNGWPFVVGRLAFPLFTVALAVGCAHKTIPELRAVAAKLSLWGVVALVVGGLVRDVVPLNVLFTFALGIVLHVCMRETHAVRLLVGVAVLMLSAIVEYKLLGVVAVAVAMHAARRDKPLEQAGWMLFALCLIVLVRFNAPAVLAIPVVFLLNAAHLEVARVRGAFYWGYAGHFALLALVRPLL